MNKHTRQRLLDLVRASYQTAADDFSRSRKNLSWPQTEALITNTLPRCLENRCLVSKNEKRDNDYEATMQRSNETTRVLDLGCGNGRLLDVLKKYDVNYTGIEQSPVLADHARDKIRREKLANAEVIVGDIVEMFITSCHCERNDDEVGMKRSNPVTTSRDEIATSSRSAELRSTPRNDTAYNLILLIAVLPHLPSRRLRVDVLCGIRESLAADGRLIVTCWNLRAHPRHKHTVRKHGILKLLGKNHMEFGDIVFPGFHDKTPRYYHAYTERGLRKELAKAGLVVERLYSDDKNIYAVVKKRKIKDPTLATSNKINMTPKGVSGFI